MENKLEKRIKLLEEELAWLQKDFMSLMEYVKELEPENHVHYTNIFYTNLSAEDKEEPNDLDQLM